MMPYMVAASRGMLRSPPTAECISILVHAAFVRYVRENEPTGGSSSGTVNQDGTELRTPQNSVKIVIRGRRFAPPAGG